MVWCIVKSWLFLLLQTMMNSYRYFILPFHTCNLWWRDVMLGITKNYILQLINTNITLHIWCVCVCISGKRDNVKYWIYLKWISFLLLLLLFLFYTELLSWFLDTGSRLNTCSLQYQAILSPLFVTCFFNTLHNIMNICIVVPF